MIRALSCGLAVALLGLTASHSAAAAPEGPARAELLDAYKKEFAFLQAERDALAKRLAAVQREASARVGAAKAAVERAQRELIGARGDANRLEGELRDLDRDAAQADEKRELLPDTLERARQTLSKAALGLPRPSTDAAEQAAAVAALAVQVGELMARQRSVRSGPGAFFLPDGRAVEGTLVYVGDVATWGISDAGGGALVPAGDGRLALWHQDARATADAMARGQAPAALRLFLYDTLDKRIEQRPAKTPLSIVESGGAIAWVIVGLGACAVLLILLRVLWLALAGAGTGSLADSVAALVAQGRAEEALSKLRRARGSAARVLRVVLANLHRTRSVLEDLVSEAIVTETPRIERFGTAITVFAAIAPLLGLLGTVTGMISTFDIITEHGTGDPKLLSGGISEALVTTELGLIVAIPTLLIGTLLAGRANHIALAMERAALRIVNVAHTGRLEAAGGGAAATDADEEDEACSTTPLVSSESTSAAAAS